MIKEEQPVSARQDEMIAMAQALLAAIPDDKQNFTAYRVIRYLAEETIKQVPEVGSPRFSTKDIHTDLGGNKNVEPSAWFSRIWKEIGDKAYPSIEHTLIQCCREAGLSCYPEITKADGKPAYYSLHPKPLPVHDVFESDGLAVTADILSETLRYEPDLTLRLSRLGRLLFGNGLLWTTGKRRMFMAWFVLQIIGALLVVEALWLVLASDKGPMSSRSLILIGLMVFLPWFFYRRAERSVRLFDDRIMIAPDWMLHWKEQGATVEVSRAQNADAPSTIRVLRYTANCPICGTMVKLDKGEPDFPRRLVGRCIEGPREHVFSFDRVTRSGSALRHPPVSYQLS